MNTGLSITTFGDLTFAQNGEIVTNFSSRKAEALLVYLGVENAPHRRESLFTLLWPGMPEKSARHNLRQVLYAMRQLFGNVAAKNGSEWVPLLLSDRQTVQINPEAALDIDVLKMKCLIEDTQVHDHLNLESCEPCIQALESVINLYTGDFLRDFYLEDSNIFEDWVAAHRETYRTMALETLGTLTELSIHKGALGEAREFADQQLKIDPLREIAYRQLMELLSKSGQRAEALRTYQQCARKLEIELGTHPSRETTALFEIIRGEDVQRSRSPVQEGKIRGYEIRENLGSGHAGAVYKAYQPVIGRDVAIKVILPQFANHPDFIRRFEVEAQLVARLEHPYIVPLYDYWRDPSGAYLVMRWLKGGSLQTDLARGAWKPQAAVRLVEQIAAALTLAHRQDVVHCDIKPANILLDDEGNAYLTDFGIAILTGPLVQLSQSLHSGNGGSSSGSLGYVSPETARGLDTTSLADIYSLGVVAYELLTGTHPFQGIDGEALVQKHLSEPVPSVLKLRPELPEAVNDVIQKATQKDPKLRYQRIDTLAREFRLALIPESTQLTELPDAIIVSRNPYKGLRPFTEADAFDFFGRDELVARLLNRISPKEGVQAPGRFLAVVGPSGSGKSSVVKAGLIPAIRKGAIHGSESWFVAEMTPGSHPLEELETALLRIAIETPDDLSEQLQADRRGLIKVLRRTLPGRDNQVLLVIDQFEELFTLVEHEIDRNHFFELLVAAVHEPHTPLRLVITLRADFYDRPLQHSGFGKLVRKATEVVLPLSHQELERAIRSPAKGVGAALEPALMTQIVGDVGDQPGTLPLLQYALTECFERREDDQLTLAAYQASGGVLGALGRRAEEIYTDVDEDEQEMIRQLFLRLVTLGEGVDDTRRRVPQSELESVIGDRPVLSGVERSTDISPVIDQYGKYRLLTFDHDPATRAPTVEVAHEALLQEWPRLRGWLDESRDDIRMQRMLGAASLEWQESGKAPGYLLREARLDQFALWFDDTNVALTADENAYLDASLEARKEREDAEAQRQAHEARLEQHSRRFLQALVGVFAMAALIAVILSIFLFNAQEIAQQEAESRATQQAIAEAEVDARTQAEAQALEDRDRAVDAEQEALKQASIGLASQALAEMQTANSERGVLLALAALEEYPYTPQAEATLARAVQESLPYRLIVDDLGFGLDGHWVDFSPDGKRIALGTAQNNDGERSAIIYDLYSGENDKVLSLILPFGENGGKAGERCFVSQINWSPDGKQLALVSNKLISSEDQVHCHNLQIYDSKTGELLHSYESFGEFSVDWSPDGRYLLTGGENGVVRVLDAATGNVTLDLTGHTKSPWELFMDKSDWIFAARYSPDGSRAATFSLGGIVHIWNTRTGELLQTLEHPQEYLSEVDQFSYPGTNKIGLSWSPDGSQIATAWYDGLARVWDVEKEEVDQLLAGHTSIVTGIDWSPDGAYVLTQGADSTSLWVASTGQLAIKLPGSGYGNAAWSSDSRWIAQPIQGGLLAWNTSVLPPILNPSIPIKGTIIEALWSPDGKLLVLSGASSMVFDWSGNNLDWQLPPNDGFFAISPDSTKMIASELYGSEERRAQIIDLYSGEVLARSMALPPIDLPAGQYFTHSWSNDGKKVASGTYPEFWTVIWDPITGEELARSETTDGFMMRAQFSPDDSLLAAPALFATGNSPVSIIDVESGKTITKLPSEDGWSIVAMWSPVGKQLAVGYQNGVIKLWETETWTVIKTFDAHQGRIWDLNWSPNGERIISGDADNGIIHIWEADSGNIVTTWVNSHGNLNDLDWSPDGQFILYHGESDIPTIHRAWQSTEGLIDYAYECCVWRELTPDEREQFGLPEKP